MPSETTQRSEAVLRKEVSATRKVPGAWTGKVSLPLGTIPADKRPKTEWPS